jgi:poly-gamma-glutamate synthesis protein (capsule biosynthesis protein)
MRYKLLKIAGLVLAVALGLAGFWSFAQAPAAHIQPQAAPDPSILFAGDIMLDRGVAAHAASTSPQALFAGVLDLFRSADANVANLEGTITTNPSIAAVNHSILHFTFDPRLAQAALAPLHLAAASQANNHAYDFGVSGYESTRQYLASWGIAPFGHPYNARDLSTIFTIRGKMFCLVGYHALYDPSTAEVVQEVQRLRPDCYKVIVFAHWGVEYEPAANLAQMGQAHELIDAGADLIIGAHPHVVENVDVYRGHAVFYSLGNFMFDQNFSWATQHGLAVRVTFGTTSTRFNLVPITIAGEEASVANEPDKQRVLEAAGQLAEFTLP